MFMRLYLYSFFLDVAYLNVSPTTLAPCLHVVCPLKQSIAMAEGCQHRFGHAKLSHCKKIFSRFVITTYFLLSNQLYNNLFS